MPLQEANAKNGSGLCDYDAVTSGENLAVVFNQAGPVTASLFGTVMSEQAKSANVTASPLPGLGQAAFIFTAKDASTNVDHVASTTIGVFAGSEYVFLTGTLTPPKIEAVARLLVH
jgi:hypothetical protein